MDRSHPSAEPLSFAMPENSEHYRASSVANSFVLAPRSPGGDLLAKVDGLESRITSALERVQARVGKRGGTSLQDSATLTTAASLSPEVAATLAVDASLDSVGRAFRDELEVQLISIL